MVTLDLPQHIIARIAERSSKPPNPPVMQDGAAAMASDLAMSELVTQRDFETEEQARAEDRTRAKGLKLARPTMGRTNWTNIGARIRLLKQMPFPVSMPPRQAEDFDRVLARLAHVEGSISNSMASAATMRVIRQTVIGAMLTAFEDFSDEELETATVINQRWVYTRPLSTR